MGFIEGLRQQSAQIAQAELEGRKRVEESWQYQKEKADETGNTRGRIFIEESNTVAQLFDRLNEFGYVDYLHSLAGHDFGPRSVLFMRGRLDYWHNKDNKPVPLIYVREPELVQQELTARQDLARKVEETSLFPLFSMADGCLGESKYIMSYDPYVIKYSGYMDPDTQFFADPIGGQLEEGFWSRLLSPHSPSPRFAEPKEVGIGFRFTKLKDETKKVILHETWGINGPFSIPSLVTKKRYSAFYVRIKSPHHAVVTGAVIQEVVDLSNLKAFDEVLDQVSKNPFSPAFTVTIEDYNYRPSKYSS